MTFTYPRFFSTAFAGKDGKDREPFDYQCRLAGAGRLPSIINVPTGAGKTAAILGAWLWRRINSQSTIGRRLVYCLPMRSLVEQSYFVAREAVKNLEQHGLIEEGRFRVYALMGGVCRDDWDIYPEHECILIGTQDMLLSRALNRGYAMSRFRWPVHFGLLNSDSCWVFDEVQLMGNGLATSTQLAAFRQAFETVGQTHSLWMSATLKLDWLETIDWKGMVPHLDVISLSGVDRESSVLSAKLAAVKVLRQADEPCRLAKGLAEFTKAKHQPGTQTLIVVNTVKRAREVYRELKKIYNKMETPQIELIHSRFRPAERTAWQALFEDRSYLRDLGRIIVATQVVEAGIDISSRVLITDLAPFSSLVQRFGRCNRNGEYEQAEIFWIDRPTTQAKIAEKTQLDESDKREIAKPYEWQELADAKHLVDQLNSASPNDLEMVSYESPYRPTHVLRRRDLVDLFDTTTDLSGFDLDISRFVRDVDERDLAVAWRVLNGQRPNKNEPAPSHDELCSVPIHELKDFLKNNKAWTWDALGGDWIEVRPEGLRAGMTILFDVEAGGYDVRLGWCGGEMKRPVPSVLVGADAEPEEAYDDERLSVGRYMQTLAAHSWETRQMLEQILAALGESIPEAHRGELLMAAQHHDWGKAHKIFQQTLHGAETAEENFEPLLAKSILYRKHTRRKFRHELGSALALLQTGASDLSVYLAACHHGRVRLSIRALPEEDRPRDSDGNLMGTRFARGIWDRDELPASDLGDGVLKERVVLDLEPMLLGASEKGAPSWLECTIALRDRFGVFRLSFFEALIRAADVRASVFPRDIYSEDNGQ
jgi:CRISPR-associated endonuclease/helicase Cas3